jgi:hypothetical protein
LRQLLKENGGEKIKIVSKIENQEVRSLILILFTLKTETQTPIHQLL